MARSENLFQKSYAIEEVAQALSWRALGITDDVLYTYRKGKRMENMWSQIQWLRSIRRPNSLSLMWRQRKYPVFITC